MPRTARQDPEPTFLGVQCKGPNPEHATECKEKAEAYMLLATFLGLDRKDQLIAAAALTEMLKDRGG